jgi:uncharacterized protein YyaL (SSP411 family)
MGARTEDYQSLSSQNFAMLGLLCLYESTRDPKYLAAARGVLEFVVRYLHDGEGRLLHHRMDGRIAWPTDPEYYCTGCNLHFLYVLRRFWEI